ncbi:glycoside hydrolase family 43 protein [Adhaeribacter radiodurans]|nr:glycoside hydrolase family 43 protein [Adhaeribacter radiodurans]
MKNLNKVSFIFLLQMVLWLPFSSLVALAQEKTFTNPLVAEGPDPWAYKHTDGNYYFMSTGGNKLSIWKSKNLSGIKQASPKVVWIPPATGPNSKDIWAPEIHFLDGKWYIYYTATDKQNPGDKTRYVFVLENSGDDPLTGTWLDKGKVNTNYSGLDGSVFEHRGKRYFMYSAYVGPQSRLFIAEMKNPWTISAKQVEIAKPTFAWEKFNDREILEGPQFLKGKKGTVHIIYSASACWDDNYALGMLTAIDESDLLPEAAWQKSPEPVFKASKENSVYGPGHNSFTKSPDGKEDWIVYHAKSMANGECSGRSTRIQKFTWKTDGIPDFGTPLSTATLIVKPSGE